MDIFQPLVCTATLYRQSEHSTVCRIEEKATIPGPLAEILTLLGWRGKKFAKQEYKKKSDAPPWGGKQRWRNYREHTSRFVSPSVFKSLCVYGVLGILLRVWFFTALFCQMCLCYLCFELLTSIWWLRWVFSRNELHCSHVINFLKK